MIEIIKSIILGLVEGITEFLPISSTGHLIVASRALNFDDPGGTFEIVIQLGAVAAVIWYYRWQLLERVRMFRTDAMVRQFWLCLLIALLPAVICGLLFEKYILGVLFSPVVVAISLVTGGLALWLIDGNKSSANEGRVSTNIEPASSVRLEEISPTQALIIGISQILALIPGISRSGSSIAGGLVAGLDRQTATAFSFYLAIPTLGGATIYKMATSLGTMSENGLVEVAVGTCVSFFSALIVVGWFLRYISRHDFKSFAVYRVFAGLALLAWISFR